MIKNTHTYFALNDTIHNFKLFKRKEKYHTFRGKYKVYKCAHCGIVGRMYYGKKFIEVNRSYSQEKLSKCNMENRINYTGKYIKILGLIFNPNKDKNKLKIKPEYKDNRFYVGSVHKVLDDKYFAVKNDHRGVWVMGKIAPVKLSNFEFELAKKSKRMKFRNKKSSKRTKR